MSQEGNPLSPDQVALVFSKDNSLHAYVPGYEPIPIESTFEQVLEEAPTYVELRLHHVRAPGQAEPQAEQLRILVNPRFVAGVTPTQTVASAIVMPGAGNRAYPNPLVQDVHISGLPPLAVEGTYEDISQKLRPPAPVATTPEAAPDAAPNV